MRNQDCTACNLHELTEHGVCQLRLPVTIEQGGLMVIGDYPSIPNDAIYIAPLQESKFKIFWQMANDVCHVDTSRVYTTYATKCQPPTGFKPSSDYALTCASIYIRQEILLMRPKAILLLGAIPASIFGLSGSISSIRGKAKEITIGKGDKKFTTTLIPAQSPSYVEYNGNELKNFALDINKAWQTVIGVTEETESPTRVTMCTTIEQVEELIGYIHQTKQCTFDFETTKLNDMTIFDPAFKATLLSVCFQHGSAYTIPLLHKDSMFSEAEVIYILQRFSDEVWGNPDIHKINQNIKFDMRVAARYVSPVFRGRVDCTMIMHSLYDDLSKHSIKEWLPTWFPKFLGWELDTKGKYGDDVPLPALSAYAGVDADGAFRGYTVLTQKLLEDDRIYDLYRNLYAFALRPLFNMEMRGMPIGRADIIKYEARALELIAEQTKKLNAYIQVHSFNTVARESAKEKRLTVLRASKAKAKGKNLEKVLAKMKDIRLGVTAVYKGINFGSPDQLCELLYSQVGFRFKAPWDKKTRGPKEATGSEVVKSLGDKTGFVNDLLVFRSLTTTYSKYLKGIRIQLDSNDCVHTTYNQAKTKTGRLSSGGKNSGINLQNIITHIKIKHPFVEELTILPKKAFTVPIGYTLLNLDFSQAELRMIAELAGEDKMIQAYNEGKDVHILTACAISNISTEKFMQLPEKERKELRQKAKSANFGLIYMQEVEGFQAYAKNTYGVNITLAEATRIKDTFFETYPKISDYHYTYIEKGKKFGCVRTLFGRRGHYPDINSNDKYLRGNAERELVNMPIQGSNGENTIFALALLEYRLPSSVLLSNSVHDSIMIMCPNKLVPYVVKVGVDTCVNTPQLRFFGKEMKLLKMACDVEWSTTNWKGLQPYNEVEWVASQTK